MRTRTLIGETGLARVITLGAGFVGVVLTARVLGPEARGEIAAATSTAALVATIVSLSLSGPVLTRAAGVSVSKWLPEVFGPLVVACVSTGLLVVGLAGAAQALSGDSVLGLPSELALVASLLVPLLVWETYGSTLLIMAKGIRIYNHAQIIWRPFGVVLIIAILAIGIGSPVTVVLSLVVAQTMVAVWGLRFLLRSAPFELADLRSRLSALVRGGLWLHLSAAGSAVSTSSGVIMLAALASASEAAFLQIGIQLTILATLLAQAVGLVFTAEVSELGIAAAWDRQRHYIGFAVAGSCALAALMFVIAPALVNIVFGPEFAPADDAVRILALNVPSMTLAALMAPYWLASGRFRLLAAIEVALGITTVAGNFLLIPDHGATGAAIVMVAIGAALIIVELAFVRVLSQTYEPRNT